MSEYGRMWQQVAEIRQMLKEPVPSIDTSATLGQATRSFGRLNGRVMACLAEWAELEKKMADCDDETGAPRTRAT